ncbi:hypothetical protein [Actinomadura macra]|uniref:hypothetical protein n=1 Tax=Actinomadura macra TaxID=46164 RepID=UPI00083758E2|nr:hypothetical protein [Actinomadura macra]
MMTVSLRRLFCRPAELIEPAAVQVAVAELHRAEVRMGASSDPDEPEFYDVCVHCTDLLDPEPANVSARRYEQLWPCPTAVAAGLDRIPVRLCAPGLFATEAPF